MGDPNQPANWEADVSELLNDSPTAVKYRDRILEELHAGEQVLCAYDSTIAVLDPVEGGCSNVYLGAVIVTNERLLSVEGKMMGRVAYRSVPWGDVEQVLQSPDGKVGVMRTRSSERHYRLWSVGIWEGKSNSSPLDKTRLDVLRLSIQEARAAVADSQATQSDSAYEELKRRRGF
jgi:hypothetical protein